MHIWKVSSISTIRLMAPPGTKALLFKDPRKRASWTTHTRDAYYVGPALKHYRAYKSYIPEKRGYRIGQSAKFFPLYCTMPNINAQDNIKVIAQDLIEAVTKYKGPNILATPQQSAALKQLADIFNTVTAHNNVTPQRVNLRNLDTTNATNKDHIQSQPWVHLKHTRTNTPHHKITQHIQLQPLHRG